MKQHTYSFAFAALLPLAALIAGCGDDGGSSTPGAGGSAQAGSGGQAGSSAGGSGGSDAGSGGSDAGSSGSGGSDAGSGGSDAGSGGSNAGSGGADAGNGGSSASTDGCSAPTESPSKGACFKIAAPHKCNPVTNEGCDTAAGEACNFGQAGFQCYPAPNDRKLCEACSEEAGFCEGGMVCFEGKCAKFCCDDGDCGGGFCNTAITGVAGLGVCTPKECSENGDCKDASKPVCVAEMATCAECGADTDCKDASKPTCVGGSCKAVGNCCEATADIPGCTDAKIKECVCAKDDFCCKTEWDAQCVQQVAEFGCGLCEGQCATEADCKDPSKPICEDNACTAKCAKDTDCKSFDKPVCVASSGKCVQCVTSKDCEDASKPVCDTATNTCVGCKEDGDCKDAAKPLCEAKTGTCVECKGDADCKDAAKPICSPAGACGKAGNCCEETPGFPGCTDAKIQECVCKEDDFCCKFAWDKQCVEGVAKYKCGTCP